MELISKLINPGSAAVVLMGAFFIMFLGYCLGRISVKGGVGKIIEYTGEGVKTLSVPERATITNMGSELGATT